MSSNKRLRDAALRAGALAASLAAFPSPASAQMDVFLQLLRSGAVRVNVAATDFPAAGGDLVLRETGFMMREVVESDLHFSGLFLVRDLAGPGPEDGDAARELLARLKEEGQDAFLTARLEGTPREMELHATLYDANAGRKIFDETFPFPRERARQAAHALADRITMVLAGEEGLARSRIAFVSNRSGKKEIYVMDYDGAGLTPMTPNGSINLSPSWVCGSEGLFFVSYLGGGPDIYLLPAPGAAAVPVSATAGLDSDPEISPDGTRIAFTMSREGNPDIYLGSWDGTRLRDPRRLTDHTGVDCCPTWAPNGRELAFVSDRAGNPQIYVMNADGSLLRRITFDGEYNASPAWSPRGDQIAYASRRDGVFDVFTISPSGLEGRRLTFGDASYESPSWSPNGRHLAVGAKRGGDMGIYILNVDGTGGRWITTGPGDDASPAWSCKSRGR